MRVSAKRVVATSNIHNLVLAIWPKSAEIAWNQGIDLFSAYDNWLLKGFEYTAKYNLGEEVPFTPYVDKTGHYRHDKISDIGRGKFRPVFEMVLDHYKNNKKLFYPIFRK